MYEYLDRFNFVKTLEENRIDDDKLVSCFNAIHKDYMDSLYKIEGINTIKNVSDYFHFTNKGLNINILYFYSLEKYLYSFLFFSYSLERKGKINIFDLLEKDLSFDILKRMGQNSTEFLSLLIQKGIINFDPETIFKNGIIGLNLPFKSVGISLLQKEYDNNFESDLKINNSSFIDIKLRKEIYEFDEIIKEIANNQFTYELTESLFVYEQKLYFVCASSLGSIIEHLLYLSIYKNIDEKEITINENSTAFEYISQLRKEPFYANKREISHLKNLFAYRNSVSHYNKGIFNKEMCDHLLSGITLIFHRYYMKNF